MMKFRFLLVVLFGLVLSSCAPTEVEPCEDDECPVCEVCEVCEVCPVNPFPEGLVLPQIYIQGKLYWTNSDLESLKVNVIDPIVEYYEEEGHTVVAITITTDDLSASSINTIIVEVMISDNDDNQDPLYMGVLIDKVDGSFPLWDPESMAP